MPPVLPGFETPTLPLLLWIIVIIAVAGFSQGALGIGFPTIATPLIAIVTDIRTAVVVVLLPCLAAVAMSAFKGVALRRVLAEFWMMPIYSFLGAAIGTRLFVAYPNFPYSLLLAAVIVVYLNLDRFSRSEPVWVKRNRVAYGALFGALSGLSEGTANVGAPPLIIYYLGLGLKPDMLVQALNICFFVNKVTQFATLSTQGDVRMAEWLVTLPFVAVGAAGAAYGADVRKRIEPASYRKWLKVALAAIAAILVGKYLYEL